MILQDHIANIRRRTGWLSENELTNFDIIAELNEGWQQVCEELRTPEICLHCNIVSGQALYTPNGFNEKVLGVKKVTYKGVPLRQEHAYVGLKDLEREARETGTPTKFSIEPRGEFLFNIRLNSTPSENVTDSSSSAGLWIWAYVSVDPVLDLNGRPQGLTLEQERLGALYALYNLYLGHSDLRARLVDIKIKRELARIRLERELPIVVGYYKFEP